MRIIKVIDNKVTETKQVLDGYVLKADEIQSGTGELGQIMQPDGTFIDDPTPPPPSGPTLEERVSAVEDALLMII